MNILKTTATALAISLLAATAPLHSVSAQQGGVQVGGNVNNTTLLNQNTNAAIGLGARANTRVAAFRTPRSVASEQHHAGQSEHQRRHRPRTRANTQIGSITGADVGGN
jgi:hypothetical protein